MMPSEGPMRGMLPPAADDGVDYGNPPELMPAMRGMEPPDMAQPAVITPILSPEAQIEETFVDEGLEEVLEEAADEEADEEMAVLVEVGGETVDIMADPALVKVFEIWLNAPKEQWEARHLQHEIAFRVWKHAASGVPTAKWWYDAVDESTAQLVMAFTNCGAVFDPQRVVLVRLALHNIHTHFNNNLTAADFIRTYEIDQKPPRLSAVPASVPE